jgi:hypothetical protein
MKLKGTDETQHILDLGSAEGECLPSLSGRLNLLRKNSGAHWLGKVCRPTDALESLTHIDYSL